MNNVETDEKFVLVPLDELVGLVADFQAATIITGDANYKAMANNYVKLAKIWMQSKFSTEANIYINRYEAMKEHLTSQVETIVQLRADNKTLQELLKSTNFSQISRLTELIEIRNKLYNELPAVETDPWELLETVKWHINDIDNFCSRLDESTKEQPTVPRWEIFCDSSYYDLWAVRPIGDKDFNSQQLFHVQSKQEAEALQSVLNAGATP